jgi:hypothetical protein
MEEMTYNSGWQFKLRGSSFPHSVVTSAARRAHGRRRFTMQSAFFKPRYTTFGEILLHTSSSVITKIDETVEDSEQNILKRMASSGMLRCVAIVRTDVSEELSATITRVTRIGELGTTLGVTSNRRTLRINTESYKISLISTGIRKHLRQ